MWKTSVWRRAPSPKGSSELPRAPPWARHLARPQLAVRLLRPRAYPNCLARRHGLAILRGHSWRFGSFAQGLIRTASRAAMGSPSCAATVGGSAPSPKGSTELPPAAPWASDPTRPQLAVLLLRPRAHPNYLTRRHGLTIRRG